MSAIRAELLDPVVVPVGHVDAAVVVDGNAPGHVQIAFGTALGAEAAQVVALLGEPLDPAVKAVDDPDVVVSIEGHARGTADLPFLFSRLAPGVKQLPFTVKDGDPVKPLIGDVNVLVLVQCHSGEPDHLTILFATPAELLDELLVHRGLTDAGASPVGHVQDVFLARGNAHRLDKTRSCSTPASYVMTILPAAPGGDCN